MLKAHEEKAGIVSQEIKSLWDVAGSLQGFCHADAHNGDVLPAMFIVRRQTAEASKQAK